MIARAARVCLVAHVCAALTLTLCGHAAAAAKLDCVRCTKKWWGIEMPRFSLQHGGRTRHFSIHKPLSRQSEVLALVIDLHGSATPVSCAAVCRVVYMWRRFVHVIGHTQQTKCAGAVRARHLVADALPG